MHLFQGLIGKGVCLSITEAALSRNQNACHGFAVVKKAPLSDKKVTVGNHDFVDVGTGVISMDPVVLAMKERVLFHALGVQQAWLRSNNEEKGSYSSRSTACF